MPKIVLSPVDVVILHPTPATALDDIRDIVDAVISGEQKVLIVDGPERLSQGGQNALRKVLEGAPEHVTIIVATDDPAWRQ